MVGGGNACARWAPDGGRGGSPWRRATIGGICTVRRTASRRSTGCGSGCSTTDAGAWQFGIAAAAYNKEDEQCDGSQGNNATRNATDNGTDGR